MTKFKVPTILEQKTDAAFKHYNHFDREKRDFKPMPNEYNPPSDHKFRDLEINKGVKDFTLRYKCPDVPN